MKTAGFYQYERDEKNRPIITRYFLAVVPDFGDPFCVRSVAVCSTVENPVKKKGRSIARSRAFHGVSTYMNTPNSANKASWCKPWLGERGAHSCPINTGRYTGKLFMRWEIDPSLTDIEKNFYKKALDNMRGA